MVVLADAVVDPGAVVVHLADAPLAHGAVVCPLRLDAAALGAFEYHLTEEDIAWVISISHTLGVPHSEQYTV